MATPKHCPFVLWPNYMPFPFSIRVFGCWCLCVPYQKGFSKSYVNFHAFYYVYIHNTENPTVDSEYPISHMCEFLYIYKVHTTLSISEPFYGCNVWENGILPGQIANKQADSSTKECIWQQYVYIRYFQTWCIAKGQQQRTFHDTHTHKNREKTTKIKCEKKQLA